jgi:hypothetical protein
MCGGKPLLLGIDPLKSPFEKGQLVPEGRPIFAQIYLRVKDRATTHIVYFPEGV